MELHSVFLTTELLCVGLTILARIKQPKTNPMTGFSLSVSHLIKDLEFFHDKLPKRMGSRV